MTNADIISGQRLFNVNELLFNVNEFITQIQLESSNFQKPLSKRNVFNITFLYAKEDLQALKERLTPKEIERLLQNNKELIEVFL